MTLRTRLIDGILKQAWIKHASLLPPDLPIALVAVGGYGRGELHPASDIDLLLLLSRARYRAVQPFAEALLRFLWDIGLTVGHSVRSVQDCVAGAHQDLTVMTNLMEARLITGDETLVGRLLQRLASPRLWPSARYYEAKCAEQRARHAHHNDTGYNLEPNVKEGPGGLRDIHMIGWITGRYLGTSDLHELVRVGFLSEHEYRSLIDSRNFLWQIRNGLHFLSRRCEDRLLFDHQRTLALQMGFIDRPGRLAVEQFMKRYYRTVQQVRLLNEIVLQHFSETLLAPRRPVVVPLSPHFQARNGFLEAIDPQVFTRVPPALLEIFVVLQQHPELKGIRAATIRLLRAELPRIDSRFRSDPDATAHFLHILRAPHGVTHVLRRMNAYGILGAYIPAFGRVVGQMQHDLFHVYTVDEHSLFVLRNVRRAMQPAFHDELPLASEISRGLVKPERLYLAALFHDIAKGRGGDHSALGEGEAVGFCARLGLSDYDTGLVAWLVRNHLAMSWIAQHSDITDPGVIHAFADLVGDREHLDNLYLLTVADIRATSPTVWNSWKGRLLSQLYSDTRRVLRRGIGVPINLAAHIADIKRDALAATVGCAPVRDIEQHWARMDSDYFLRHDAGALAWHACAIVTTSTEALPLVAVRLAPEAAGIEFLVFSPLNDDLFTILTGSFDRLNLSIVDARIHVAGDYALDCFATLPGDGLAPAPAELKHLCGQIRNDINSGRQFTTRRGLTRAVKHFPIPTEVSFSEDLRGQTVMEVVAQDRPGLLHQVGLALRACHTRIVTAKVATFGARADDVFFLTDTHGQPLGHEPSPRLTALALEVRRRLDDED
ncbi:MAG: [protein-PII] uridylyltransferase [Acidiferrobacter sp.]